MKSISCFWLFVFVLFICLIWKKGEDECIICRSWRLWISVTNVAPVSDCWKWFYPFIYCLFIDLYTFLTNTFSEKLPFCCVCWILHICWTFFSFYPFPGWMDGWMDGRRTHWHNLPFNHSRLRSIRAIPTFIIVSFSVRAARVIVLPGLIITYSSVWRPRRDWINGAHPYMRQDGVSKSIFDQPK